MKRLALNKSAVVDAARGRGLLLLGEGGHGLDVLVEEVGVGPQRDEEPAEDGADAPHRVQRPPRLQLAIDVLEHIEFTGVITYLEQVHRKWQEFSVLYTCYLLYCEKRQNFCKI